MQTIENKIIKVYSPDFIKKIKQAADKHTVTIELDGRAIPNACAFMDVAKRVFKLPDDIYYEQKADYMAVYWYKVKEYLKAVTSFSEETNIEVIIHHYEDFLREEVVQYEKSHKDLFVYIFSEILFFWGGIDECNPRTIAPRGFNVYLIMGNSKQVSGEQTEIIFSSEFWTKREYRNERIRNEILIVSSEEIQEKLDTNPLENTQVIELDGGNIRNVYDFVETLVDAFDLPKDMKLYRYFWNENKINWHVLYEHMTRLNQFPEDVHYLLIIHRFDKFLSDESEMDNRKYKTLEILENIRYFWESHVFKVIKGGKARGFSVYLEGDESGSNNYLLKSALFVADHLNKQFNPVKFIENEMMLIRAKELPEKLKTVDWDTTLLVELDGDEMINTCIFLDAMQEKFKLPRYPDGSPNWNSCSDWMRDLSWFSEETNFVVVIYNFNRFFALDTPENRLIALDVFEEIRAYWQNLVPPQGFNIYLVNGPKTVEIK